MRIHLLFYLCISCISVQAQKLISPSEFLGYPVGSRYTPHHQLVAYCKLVAQALPAQVKMVQYGQTYEQRPLYVLFVGSAENIARLENIRQQNLQRAGMYTGAGATGAQPAIVWLSYNVHGNEPSSSEAAMETLYRLLSGNNPASLSWMKNTLLIVDPCLNPDGRDRYVQFYNSQSGTIPDPNPQSREHIEPWPGGRSNHYNFDLNRDWAWQTQQETADRLRLYNQWLPQIHVDFHEQGFNEPYYFAPAAEPFHESITPWQRSMQTQIGRNHARYFDDKGWLYFTKERFDLLYPAYGDTYPTYNGSIGMTYEQGGHSRGGLAVETADGDTLTLTQRMEHHVTTGLSTVEVAHRQADSLLSQFQQFYTRASRGEGTRYKTYLAFARDYSQLKPLETLLTNNDIRFTRIGSASGSGWNYDEGRNTNFQVQMPGIMVSVQQPKGVLANILFEPQTTLKDSATYDITAWSLPYAYGLRGYAIAGVVNTTPFTPPPVEAVQSRYGFAVPWNSSLSAQLLSSLLRQGIKIRTAQKPFSSGNKTFGAGTLLILLAGNPANTAMLINQECSRLGIQPTALNSGWVDQGADMGSPDVNVIKAPKIAILTGEQVSSLAAGEWWYFMDQVLKYPASLLNANELGSLRLSEYTTLVLPDGYYEVLSQKPVQDKLKSFVREGGRIIAVQNGALRVAGQLYDMNPMETEEDGEDSSEYALVKNYADREKQELTQYTPGAIYKISMDTTHPLGFGYGAQYYSLKQDDVRFPFLKKGWNVGVLKRKMLMSGFVGSKLQKRLQNNMVFGLQQQGRGSVVLLMDDPLFRMFWEQGKLLAANALFRM